MRVILLVCVVLTLLTLGAGSLRYYMWSTSASILTHIGYMYSAEGMSIQARSSVMIAVCSPLIRDM